MAVIEFAIIMDILFKWTPYTNHNIIPTKNAKYIVKDKPSADFDFQVLYTCGRKEAVVKSAANKPIIS